MYSNWACCCGKKTGLHVFFLFFFFLFSECVGHWVYSCMYGCGWGWMGTPKHVVVFYISFLSFLFWGVSILIAVYTSNYESKRVVCDCVLTIGLKSFWVGR